MTIAELVSKLQQLDQTALVVFTSNDMDFRLVGEAQPEIVGLLGACFELGAGEGLEFDSTYACLVLRDYKLNP